MVTAFGNLKVGKMTRREFNTVIRNKMLKRVMLRLGQVVMHLFNHFLIGMRAGYRQYIGVYFTNFIFFNA